MSASGTMRAIGADMAMEMAKQAVGAIAIQAVRERRVQLADALRGTPAQFERELAALGQLITARVHSPVASAMEVASNRASILALGQQAARVPVAAEQHERITIPAPPPEDD